MKDIKPFIFYSLPKSRTVQKLKSVNKIEIAWQNVCLFLATCTTANNTEPSTIELTAYQAIEGDLNPEIADKIIENTKKIFGNGETNPISYSYPDGIPDKYTQTEWTLETKDFTKVLAYLIHGQPWHKFSLGPIELMIVFDFKFIDPILKTELPDQYLESSLMIWLSRTCYCTPDFCFPFEKVDTHFYEYLSSIENFLPFKFEHKYFRLGLPNKNKSAYKFRKF